jgi:hypothetical protein
MQRMLGVGGPAVLRRRIQTSQFCFQRDVFNQNRTQRAPHVAIGAGEDFINGRLKRIQLHSVTTAQPGWGSVPERFESFPSSVPPSRRDGREDNTNEDDQGRDLNPDKPAEFSKDDFDAIAPR